MLDGTSTAAILPSRCKVSPRLRRICRLRRGSHLATLFGLRITSKSIGEPNLTVAPVQAYVKLLGYCLEKIALNSVGATEFFPASPGTNLHDKLAS